MACTVAAGGTSKALFHLVNPQDLLMAESVHSTATTSSSLSSSSSRSPLNFTKNNSRGCSKRKKPLRIVIPSMQPLNLERELDAGVDVVELESERFSVFCKRGRMRREMEDRYKASLDVNGDPHLAFFGVYDGHGGSAAAEFAAENLDKHVMEEVAKIVQEDGVRSFETAMATAYLRTDDEFSRTQGEGGTCCVTAIISDTDLVVSNAGDCRAVISSGGIAQPLTSDHRPSRQDERARIENLGGFLSHCGGAMRVQGSVAVSRGIGDSHLKPWLTAEPETRLIKLEPGSEFLILASDGLFDHVGNQEAVDLARPFCVDSAGGGSVLAACKRLADLAVLRGSNDDVSVMIVKLPEFFRSIQK